MRMMSSLRKKHLIIQEKNNMTTHIHAHRILIIDFGSQYAQLIARRVRDAGVYCELMHPSVPDEKIRAWNPSGIILSGGPETVIEHHTPRAPKIIFELNVPILGICYGMQTMAAQLGGQVESSDKREFGLAECSFDSNNLLFRNLGDSGSEIPVWMSHGDHVTQIPAGFKIIAKTNNAPIAAMCDESKQFYAVQFHPEVTHTSCGKKSLKILSTIFVIAIQIGRQKILLKKILQTFEKKSAKKKYCWRYQAV